MLCHEEGSEISFLFPVEYSYRAPYSNFTLTFRGARQGLVGERPRTLVMVGGEVFCR